MYILVSDRKKKKKGKQMFPARVLFPEMWLALQKSYNLKFPTGAAPDTLCSPPARAGGYSLAQCEDWALLPSGIGRKGRRRQQETRRSLLWNPLCFAWPFPWLKGAEYLFGCIWFVWFHSGSGGAGVPFQCPPCSEQLTLLGKYPKSQRKILSKFPCCWQLSTGSLAEQAGPITPH